MKRLLAAASALLLGLSAGGCTFSGSVEALMVPPKLSVEQEQIYAALQSVAGNRISLKYPKSGDYLSAFIISDIDRDGDDEAIVFYERGTANADENPLRVNVLDQFDGTWRSVYDRGAAGAEVEEVIISPLGENDRVNIIIGYTLASSGERVAEVFDYRDSTLERTLSKDYSLMRVRDLDGNGTQELLIVSEKTAGQRARAASYHLAADGTYYESAIGLDADFTECTQLLCGSAEDGSACVFIDGVVGPTTIATEILQLAGDRLQRVAATPDDITGTTRHAGYAAQDIDHDGVVEIPRCELFPGYAELGESEQLTMTDWYTLADGRLLRKHSGYYSINDSYAFLLPRRWEGKVTLKRDSVAGELVFYAFSDTLADSRTELLRFCVTADPVTLADCLENGYLLLGAKGGLRYLALRADTTDPLLLSTGEVVAAFLY